VKAEVEAAFVDMCNAVGIPREDAVSMTVDNSGISFTVVQRGENNEPVTSGDGVFLVKAYFAL